MQVLDAGPGDREAVEGRRAAADLVEDDQRTRGRLIEDRRRLDHLDHEGRTAAREIVRRADAGEQAVDDRRYARAWPARKSPSAPSARSARSAAVGRFARHVRAGDDGDAPAFGDLAGEIAIVGDEGFARALERRLDDRMASALDRESERGVDLRARPVALDGKFGERRGDIDPGERGAEAAHARRLRAHACAAARRFEFERQRAFGGGGDLRLEIGEFAGREAHRVGHRLAMDEGRVERRLEQLLALRLRHLDKKAEEILCLILSAGRRSFEIFRLQRGDDVAAFVAQRAGLVEVADAPAR